MANIEPTEMALSYCWLFKTVDPTVLTTPGYTFIGPFNNLLTYPKMIQTMTYSGDSMLHGRTLDGLPLSLSVTFQYQLLPDGVYKLYHEYEYNAGDYKRFYRLIGTHLITEMVTHYSAFKFFNNKQKIATAMQKSLNTYFQKHLYASIQSLQINNDHLPTRFTQQIIQAAMCRQNITKMIKVRAAKKIDFQTARIVARAQANVTVSKAHGKRNHIIQNGHADAAIISYNVQAERSAYGKIKKELKLNSDNMIDYILYDTVAGGSFGSNKGADKDVSLLVGVNPQSYVNDR